ncbi:MAG: hypothetical protein CSB16_01160 [Clostridiales bacterium]|nr:MAG: hypothetical protein CSB16_01160 [Clostridiales bacterium]
MRKNDLVVIFIILVIALFTYGVFYFLSGSDAEYVVVKVDGEEIFNHPLNEDIEKKILTEYGENILVVKDKKVYIRSADCPNKICVNHRAVSKPFESIVCIPNKLVVEIRSDDGRQGVDIIAE